MPTNRSSVESLRRVFQQGFTTRDLAEPLVSFDATTSASDVRSFLINRRYEVVGVRCEGVVAGYVQRDDLEAGTCGDSLRQFDESQVVLDSMPLFELVMRLKNHSRLFVSMLGRIGGIVSRSDMQKPPARMWLFGLVTLIEMRFTEIIEQSFPDGEWRSSLSDGRMQKAVELLAQRACHHQELDLLDCLQLSDKATIVSRSEQLRAITQFGSKRQLEDATKMLERLRNSLAHAQDIVTNDWETIVLLAERLDSILTGPTTKLPINEARAD